VYWSVLGAAAARGAGVLASIAVARVLGIIEFGEFTVVQSTVGLFGTFAGLGLGVTATKYVAELRESDPSRCGTVICVVLFTAAVGGVLAGLGLVWGAPWLASRTLAAPHIAPFLCWGALLVALGAFQGACLGVLAGFESFKRAARVNLWAALLGTPAMVAATMADGLRGAVWGSALQLAIGCWLGLRASLEEASRAGVRLNWRSMSADLGIIWSFSVPAFISSTLAGPANWACNTLLVNQPGGYEQVALLNAAGQWRNALIFLPMTVAGVLVPVMASANRSANHAELPRFLRRNLLLVVALSLAMSAPVALLAPVILSWYGSGFQAGVAVFVLASLGTCLVAPTNLFSRALQAAGRPWLELTFSVVWAFLLVASCWLLVPRLQAVGLQMAHLLSAAVLGLWQWWVVRGLARVWAPRR
jgi:O-antigen/teichoic acid export membrane protein